jgi:hypothetical protein
MRVPRVRFAFRLARELGIADPLAWLDTVDPVVVDCFAISCEQYPLPDPWLQTATIAMEIYQLASLIAASKGARFPELSIDHWMPARGKSPDTVTSTPTMTIEQELKWAARRVMRG